MKIILTKDVNKVGKQYDIRDVATGFAKNYLFPQGLAMLATPVTLRQLQERRIALARKEQRMRSELENLIPQLEQTSLAFSMKVNEKGEPFGSITEGHIAEKLQEKGFRIKKHAILLDKPIKELGAHRVTVNLGAEVAATITVTLETKK